MASKASAVLLFLLAACAPNARSEVFSSSEHDDTFYQAATGPPDDGNHNGSSASTKHPSTNGSMRRDQSRDLKRLIQELEESDYSNYGSWGNFRSRPPPPPPPSPPPPHAPSSSSPSSAPPDPRRGRMDGLEVHEEGDDGASFGDYLDDPYYPSSPPGTAEPRAPVPMSPLQTSPYVHGACGPALTNAHLSLSCLLLCRRVCV